jgi:hypothetical protein
MSEICVPIQYLFECSIAALESVQLSRLNQVAALRQEFRNLADEWIQSEIDARVATGVLANRRNYNGADNIESVELRAQTGDMETSLLWLVCGHPMRGASPSCADAVRFLDAPSGNNPRDHWGPLTDFQIYCFRAQIHTPPGLFEHAELFRIFDKVSADRLEHRKATAA